MQAGQPKDILNFINNLYQHCYASGLTVFNSIPFMTRILAIIISFILIPDLCFSQNGILHNRAAKVITITTPDQKLSIRIDYSKGCIIKQVNLKNKNTISSSGVYTGITTGSETISSADQTGDIKITNTPKGISLSAITYGTGALQIEETWDFTIKGDKITWDIARNYSTTTDLEDMAFPKWNFTDLSVWKGGIIDNGGMVWCKYLKQINDTYGVHTGGVTFWNADSGDALRISAQPGSANEMASKYSHSENGEFTFTQLLTASKLQQRHHLSRFVSEKYDVFAPFQVKKGRVKLSLELQYIDYNKEYARGTLPGIDATAVRELLNTTGRYGVVDNNIVGANGWLTNWKCLHEPFFAQIGLALNDPHYMKNLAATLDQERDQAMLNDGRVLSRWHNEPGDEIPGTYNPQTGYYEAMWGYTIDSQTGYVINTSELFELNGDLQWLRAHQASCEKALNWLIKRDSNNNGIYEMMNNGVAEKRASDWLDIVWASFENAFVNAQLYEALTLWAQCETVLGNQKMAGHYSAIATRLKNAFNKPVDEGGFWSPTKQQYVYWRDKDNTIHGDNLVTPVNFAAIAFGLCDDKERIKLILDQIEQRTTAEHLFHWPLCFDSFKREEVSDGNWPFPKYENGDIFPTWGYLGINAYVKYDKHIALKFINHLLDQYKKDGLSSQRYSRPTQLGMGDDILAGICTSITALYKDIYGLRPKWNRMGLEPNMLETLNGTKFSYTHRGTVYHLELSVNDYVMSTNGFSVKSNESFGADKSGNTLKFYPGNKDTAQLLVRADPGNRIDMKITSWKNDVFTWTISSRGVYQFTINGLQPGIKYEVITNKNITRLQANNNGSISLNKHCSTPVNFSIRETSH